MAVSRLLSLLLMIISFCLHAARIEAATTVTITSRTVINQLTSTYTSTITATSNPAGIPTLIYNCAKMPAICNNVDQYLHRQVPPAGLDPLYKTIPGNGYLDFHYDSNRYRVNARRNSVCPGNWYNNHPCPEPSQPPVVVAGGWVNARGDFQGEAFVGGTRIEPNSANPIGAMLFEITNPARGSAYQGMIWSCDEFPPAT